MTGDDVIQMRQVAYVMAQTVAAMARIAGMQAINAERAAQGHAQAYVEEAFEQVIQEFGLHHNSVIENLRTS